MQLKPDTRSPQDPTPDPLYQSAVDIVVENRLGSVALVQRHLRLGYERAQKLLERMHAQGIVGETQENGLRAVLAPYDEQGDAATDKSGSLDSAYRSVVVQQFLALSKKIKK